MTADLSPVPCPAPAAIAANGPNGTDDVVDVSGLTPDQQFQAGLFCGSVHATPTTSDQRERLVPGIAVRLQSAEDPSAGNRGRRSQSAAHFAAQSVRPRGGTRQSFPRRPIQMERPPGSHQSHEQDALYNFLSTFSGTHYVTPRAITGTIGFHF